MSRTVIYTINKEEYRKAMKILDKLDYTWRDSDPCDAEWEPICGVDRLIYLYLYDDNKTITFTTIKPEKKEYDNIMPLEKFIELHPLHPSSFTKADLEDGMVVQTNGGDYYMYFKKFERFIKEDGYLRLNSYNDDLTNKYDYDDPEFNIKAVFVVNNLCTLDLFKEGMNDRLEKIWERPEKVRMTIKEIEEKLGIENLEIVEE